MKYVGSDRFWRSMLVAMLVPLALFAFWPSPVDDPVHGQLAYVLYLAHAQGIPEWFNYQFIEASANVLLFVPVGVVAGLAYSKRRWWQVGILGFPVSGGIELGQLLFLHNRVASGLDLVTNTGGAILGALMAALAVKRLQARTMPAGL